MDLLLFSILYRKLLADIQSLCYYDYTRGQYGRR